MITVFALFTAISFAEVSRNDRERLVDELTSQLFASGSAESLLQMTLLRMEAATSNARGSARAVREQVAVPLRNQLAKPDIFAGMVRPQFDSLSTEEIRALVEFARSPVGGKALAAVMDLGLSASATAATRFEGLRKDAMTSTPVWIAEHQRLRQASADLNSIAVALEAYSRDQQPESRPPRPAARSSYPAAATIHDLAGMLVPKYLRRFPEVDPWGQSYVYIVTADRAHYRLLSGGSDARIETQSRQIETMPSRTGVSQDPGEDIILQDGSILLAPSASLEEEENPPQ
jgi:hypothetical protein